MPFGRGPIAIAPFAPIADGNALSLPSKRKKFRFIPFI